MATDVKHPLFMPVNLEKWIKQNQSSMKPPVSNRSIWKDQRETMIFVSHGPNTRNDFHVNATEEFFYQLKGDIAVRVRPLDGSKPFEVIVKEGEVYLLPAHVPHRPQRPAGTTGLVVELKRPAGAMDKLQWYCDKCDNLVYEHAWELKQIDEDLAVIMDRFWNGDVEDRTCQKCGAVIQRATTFHMPGSKGVKAVLSKGTPAAAGPAATPAPAAPTAPAPSVSKAAKAKPVATAAATAAAAAPVAKSEAKKPAEKKPTPAKPAATKKPTTAAAAVKKAPAKKTAKSPAKKAGKKK